MKHSIIKWCMPHYQTHTRVYLLHNSKWRCLWETVSYGTVNIRRQNIVTLYNVDVRVISGRQQTNDEEAADVKTLSAPRYSSHATSPNGQSVCAKTQIMLLRQTVIHGLIFDIIGLLCELTLDSCSQQHGKGKQAGMETRPDAHHS